MTTALQNLINEAAAGTTVRVPPGTYKVDAVNDPITVKSGVTLDLTNVTLKALPTDQGRSAIIKLWGVDHVTIINGMLIGERDSHIGDAGSQGMGIDIGSPMNGTTARDIAIRLTHISGCWGDGIQIEGGYNVTLNDVLCDRNRRQGLSVIECTGLTVTNCQFSNSGGTPPGCGIDLESDRDNQAIRDITISRNTFINNAGSGIAVGSLHGVYANIRITDDNYFDHRTQPIWAAGNAAPLGTSWYAMMLNRTCGWLPNYRWWYYPTSWYRP
jgi:hypothetical protein